MDQPAPFHREILALADTLRPALLRASRALRREAQRAGVSALDAQILMVIKKHPGIGVCDLADSEQMTRASMSGHVKRLAQAAWVERMAGANGDRRRAGLAITPRGSKALEAIRRRRNDWLADRLSRLTPEARAALAAACDPLGWLSEDRS